MPDYPESRVVPDNLCPLPSRVCPAETYHIVDRVARIEEKTSAVHDLVEAVDEKVDEKFGQLSETMQKVQEDVHAIRSVFDQGRGVKMAAGAFFGVIVSLAAFLGWLASTLHLKITVQP